MVRSFLLVSFVSVLDWLLKKKMETLIKMWLTGLSLGGLMESSNGVLYDRSIPFKLKRKFYRIVIRPAMLYVETDVGEHFKG